MNTISKIENMIERILKDRNEALAQLDGQIADNDAAIAAANEAMDKATSAGDLKAYQKAKAERTAAADGKEMYEARKNALSNKPLISESEYLQACADIRAEIAALDDKTKQELTAFSNQMNASANALNEAISKANEVLARLQHDLYRDQDRSRNPKTGEIIPVLHEQATVNPAALGTVKWGRAGVEAPQYKAYTGHRGE